MLELMDLSCVISSRPNRTRTAWLGIQRFRAWTRMLEGTGRVDGLEIRLEGRASWGENGSSCSEEEAGGYWRRLAENACSTSVQA
jgi:hypothetical protein